MASAELVPVAPVTDVGTAAQAPGAQPVTGGEAAAVAAPVVAEEATVEATGAEVAKTVDVGAPSLSPPQRSPRSKMSKEAREW